MTTISAPVSPPILAISGITPGTTASDGQTTVALLAARGRIDVADVARTISVYDLSIATGTTSADASGNLSLSGVILSQRANSLTAPATNDVGTGTSPVFTATPDTTTFVSPITSSAVTTGTDGRSYVNAANFNGGVITLSGAAELGDSVVVVDRTGNSVVGTAVVQPDGSWTVTVSGLADGNVDSYVATATDAAGNVASSRALTFTVDNNAIVTLDRYYYNQVTLPWQAITGKTSGLDSGSQVLLFDNGGATPIGTATVGLDGSWRADVYLYGLGTHDIVARTTDAAGNHAESAPTSFQLGDETGTTTIASFSGTEVSTVGPLIADSDGNLFGTTRSGGAYGFGQVFEIVKTDHGYAAPITLASFNSLNGSGPTGSLVFDADGNLYGTTIDGGLSNNGVVYKITKSSSGYDNTPIPLVYFDGTNGANPDGNLIIDANGNLFGTTSSGGAGNPGTVFEVVRSVNGYASSPLLLASSPAAYVGLAVDSSGNLFATTGSKIVEFVKTANGYSSTPTILADFNASYGSFSLAPTIDSNGNLFAIVNFSYGSQAFKLTRTADGYTGSWASAALSLTTPTAPLIVDSQGNLFWSTTNGVYETVKGNNPGSTILIHYAASNSLTVDAAGNLFGTTGTGSVFEINNTGYVPAVTIAGIGAGAVFGDVVVSGSAASGSTVSVYDGTVLLGTSVSSANGIWSFTSSLTSGAHDLSATVIDAGEKVWMSPALRANLVSSGNISVTAPSGQSFFIGQSGILSVVYGASINGAVMSGGGTGYIGGVSNGTSVLSGGIEIVTGTANTTSVATGGVQNVIQGGTALGTIVMAGGFQGIDHATATGTVLSGEQQVLAGGLASATIVNAGARQYIGADGAAIGTSVSSSGMAYIDLGGTSTGAIIAGYEMVLGASFGATIKVGGVQDNQGTAVGTIIAAGGVQTVTQGGTSAKTVVNAGGFQSVHSGGSATSTTLNGEQQVLDGGTAVGTVIRAGGREYVGSGGETIGSVIDINGLQYIDAGASDSGSVVYGGLQYVMGAATGTTIDVGGKQEIGAGGRAVNSYVTSGTEHVHAGGLAEGADFDGVSIGTLILDDPSLFAGSIVNFGAGDRVDFRNVTNASIDETGHLNLTSAGGAFSWGLLGQYAAADFTLASDGLGGTMLTFQPSDNSHVVSIVSHA